MNVGSISPPHPLQTKYTYIFDIFVQPVYFYSNEFYYDNAANHKSTHSTYILPLQDVSLPLHLPFD